MGSAVNPASDPEEKETIHGVTHRHNTAKHRGSPVHRGKYLESLRGPRDIWIYGERVQDLTTHPAFRNAARMLARLYDAARPGAPRHTDVRHGHRFWGYTQKYFRAPSNADDLVGARDAIAAWARMTYGWMGRSRTTRPPSWPPWALTPTIPLPGQRPTLVSRRPGAGAVRDHALAHPPVDRQRPPDDVADVYVHVEKETDAGLVVSGAKVVATGSALTHYNFIAHIGGGGPFPLKNKAFATGVHCLHGHAGRQAHLPSLLRPGRRGGG